MRPLIISILMLVVVSSCHTTKPPETYETAKAQLTEVKSSISELDVDWVASQIANIELSGIVIDATTTDSTIQPRASPARITIERASAHLSTDNSAHVEASVEEGSSYTQYTEAESESKPQNESKKAWLVAIALFTIVMILMRRR